MLNVLHKFFLRNLQQFMSIFRKENKKKCCNCVTLIKKPKVCPPFVCPNVTICFTISCSIYSNWLYIKRL